MGKREREGGVLRERGGVEDRERDGELERVRERVGGLKRKSDPKRI